MRCIHCPILIKIHPELTSPHKFSLQHTKSLDVELEYLWIVLTHDPRATFTVNYEKLSLCNIIGMTVYTCVCCYYAFYLLTIFCQSIDYKNWLFLQSMFVNFLEEIPWTDLSWETASDTVLHFSLYSLLVILYYCFRLIEGSLVAVPFSLELLCVNSKILIIWIHKTETFQ